MNTEIRPFASGTGWGELFVQLEWPKPPDGIVPGTPAHVGWQRHDRQAKWIKPDKLTLYDGEWRDGLELQKTHSSPATNAGHFYAQHHGKGRDKTGGHNWRMTTRFDVWAWVPFEPFQWHGFLITGGNNSTFRMRRTRKLADMIGLPKLTCRRRGLWWPYAAEMGCLRLARPGETLGFVKRARHGWVFGATIPELLTRFLMGEAAAA